MDYTDWEIKYVNTFAPIAMGDKVRAFTTGEKFPAFNSRHVDNLAHYLHSIDAEPEDKPVVMYFFPSDWTNEQVSVAVQMLRGGIIPYGVEERRLPDDIDLDAEIRKSKIVQIAHDGSPIRL